MTSKREQDFGVLWVWGFRGDSHGSLAIFISPQKSDRLTYLFTSAHFWYAKAVDILVWIQLPKSTLLCL